MPSSFNFNHAPFDCLSPAERRQVQNAVDIAYYPAGTVILHPDMPATHVHVVIKGHVQHHEGDEVVSVYGPDDFFAARAAMAGRTTSVLTALDEVITYQLPQATLKDLVAGNSRFSALLFADMSRRLSAVAEGNQSREFLSLMMTKVRDAFIRKPFFVDGSTDLVTLCAQLSERGLTNALVHDTDASGQPRVGMFTTTDLRDALLRPTPPAALPVRDVARFDLITVTPDTELFDALLVMIRHRVHRVLVRESDGAGGTILGVLSQLDLMGFISNHSHLIALQVQQATTVAELQTAAQQMDGLIAVLHNGGVKIEVISTLVSELNSQIFAKLWGFVAPPELAANSCLLVMGSEGRGEQVLKTDQDNALILRDGFEFAGLADVAQRFNQALATFGYPPCPGHIMLTNPLWRQPLAGFKTTIADWLLGSHPDGPMHLAIFMDARAVAGDTDLLHQARAHLQGLFGGSDALLARFASAVEQFSEPGTWWDRLSTLRGREEQSFDLKKLGTFPIVHGVRALALEHQLDALRTTERIHQLATRGHLDATLARDLVDALRFLMGLKLKNNLRQRQLGEAPHHRVKLSELGTLERDLLKDSLAIIKRFKQHLRTHFKLEAL
jgi:CBS domain-containing protein